MPTTPLAKKLFLKAGLKAALLNAPAGYAETLAADEAGAEIVSRPSGNLDFVQVFARNAEEFAKWAPKALGLLKPDGLLWICYPKGSSGLKTDLNRDKLWTLAEPLGLRPVTLVAVDETWSAMRFRAPEKVKTAKPK